MLAGFLVGYVAYDPIGGYLDVSKALIEAGANPSLGNGHCDTPLLVAAGWDRINLVSAPQAS